MNSQLNVSISKCIFFLIAIFSCMMLVKIDVFSAFFIVQVMGIGILSIRKSGKLHFSTDRRVNFVFLSFLISTVACQFSTTWLSYRKAAIAEFILLIPVYFTYAYLEYATQDNCELLSILKKGVQCACVIQLVWCLLQFVLYRLWTIDLNQIVFVNILHTVESASHYKAGAFLPSGMCWHAAFMAPVAAISYMIFDNWVIKGLAVLDAIVCNNATALIVICICVFLDFIFQLRRCNETKKIRAQSLAAVLVLIVLIPYVMKTGIWKTVLEKVVYIIQRITGSAFDGGSADAHIRYYTDYPKVLQRSSLIQILFGYGLGCSGYPISVIKGQYDALKSWAVESDVIDILVSRGVFGFFIFYGWIIRIAARGIKTDYRYFVLAVALAAGGITYNIQFDWVILIELMLWLSLKRNVNFFQNITKKTTTD